MMKIAPFLLPFTLITFLPSQSSLRQGHLRPAHLYQRHLSSSERTLTRIFESDDASIEKEKDSDAAVMAKILAAADDNVFMR